MSPSSLHSQLSSPFILKLSTLHNGCTFNLPTLRRSNLPPIRISSLSTTTSTELDAISKFSEIVPDTVIFDDFDKFSPTAATVSSSLLLGICGLPDTIFKNAVDMALADQSCASQPPDLKFPCITNKAIVNVGSDLVKLVPGRVSTEVDARLAYDTPKIISKVHELLTLYSTINVPSRRLLFKIPATWEGIEAARVLEAEGIQTHLTFVYCFPQAAAAAQAGASVIQIFVGRIRDWARTHTGDAEVDEALRNGDDPGLALMKKAYNYVHKYGYASKLMAAAVRNKQDLFSLLGVDYIIAPVKILQSLKESASDADEKYSYAPRLSPASAANCSFTEEELVKWDKEKFDAAMGPAAGALLGAGVRGYAEQSDKVEELFGKMWPPPNV